MEEGCNVVNLLSCVLLWMSRPRRGNSPSQPQLAIEEDVSCGLELARLTKAQTSRPAVRQLDETL